MSVVKEFANELDSVGSSLSGGLLEAFGFWNAKLPNKLRNEAGVCYFADLWGRLKRMSVEELGTIFASENMEVATVKLSKLDTGKAVHIFGSLPDDHVCKIRHIIWIGKNCIRPMIWVNSFGLFVCTTRVKPCMKRMNNILF